MSPIPVHLAVEDDLSESVIRRLLLETGRNYSVGNVFGRGGFGYLQNTAKNWNAAAAAGTPILLLTDLDHHPCPSGLIEDWLDVEPDVNLVFRVAVREVESWLLADREGFADFLGISDVVIPLQPDQIPDPKLSLINLARRSRRRTLRESIVPREGSTAVQGPDYNGCLGGFVRNHWNHNAASERSPSLGRAWRRLMVFEPTWAAGA
jgi:hypothetical protein